MFLSVHRASSASRLSPLRLPANHADWPRPRIRSFRHFRLCRASAPRWRRRARPASRLSCSAAGHASHSLARLYSLRGRLRGEMHRALFRARFRADKKNARPAHLTRAVRHESWRTTARGSPQLCRPARLPQGSVRRRRLHRCCAGRALKVHSRAPASLQSVFTQPARKKGGAPGRRLHHVILLEGAYASVTMSQLRVAARPAPRRRDVGQIAVAALSYFFPEPSGFWCLLFRGRGRRGRG